MSEMQIYKWVTGPESIMEVIVKSRQWLMVCRSDVRPVPMLTRTAFAVRASKTGAISSLIPPMIVPMTGMFERNTGCVIMAI